MDKEPRNKKLETAGKAADTAVVLVKDSFPVYNADVAARLALTVPDAYASAQKVTTAG